MVEFTKMREEEGKDDLKYRVSLKSCFFNSHLTSKEHHFY